MFIFVKISIFCVNTLQNICDIFLDINQSHIFIFDDQVILLSFVIYMHDALLNSLILLIPQAQILVLKIMICDLDGEEINFHFCFQSVHQYQNIKVRSASWFMA